MKKQLTKTTKSALKRIRHLLIIAGLLFIAFGVAIGFVVGAIVK